jgi:hypothetical protein
VALRNGTLAENFVAMILPSLWAVTSRNQSRQRETALEYQYSRVL